MSYQPGKQSTLRFDLKSCLAFDHQRHASRVSSHNVMTDFRTTNALM
jgi:hypothetical protein